MIAHVLLSVRNRYLARPEASIFPYSAYISRCMSSEWLSSLLLLAYRYLLKPVGRNC